MGMLYVLDEPSIGLHPKDNVKMIDTLESLRDIGNTVIVVEHDEDTIRAADHLVEIGPGPGVHGGKVVVQGTLADVLACKASLTGQFLSGKRSIATPRLRRGATASRCTVRVRAEQPQDRRRDVPAGQARLRSPALRLGQELADSRDPLQGALDALVDSRALAGEHDGLDGIEHVTTSSASINRRSAGTAGPTRRRTSASTTRSATFSPRRRCAGTRVQAGRGSASTSRAAAARSARARE